MVYERNDPYYSGSSSAPSNSVSKVVKSTSASSGDTVVSDRNKAKEAEARAVGYTQEQINSRGGINSQGYFNDVPVYQQLTANERKSVTNADGSINTKAMLSILDTKEKAEFGPIKYARMNNIPLSSMTDTSGSAYLTATPSLYSSAPTTSVTPISKPPIKTATPDIVLFNDDTVPIETMTDLIFEKIGGQELINIARSDTINGQKIVYQPIKNLSSIQQQYNSKNILSISDTSDKYFNGFPIKLENKIPSVGSGSNGEYVYFASGNDLVVEAVNLQSDEQIEIQIQLDGTIYMADI